MAITLISDGTTTGECGICSGASAESWKRGGLHAKSARSVDRGSAQAEDVWLIYSTHGRWYPDNLLPFYEALQEKQADLSPDSFWRRAESGDREYDTFCGAIDKIDSALKACGAQIGETLNKCLEHEIPEDRLRFGRITERFTLKFCKDRRYSVDSYA